MATVITFAFLNLNAFCDWAREVGAMPAAKAAALAKADQAIEKTRLEMLDLEKRSKCLEGVVEQIAEDKRLIESQKADQKARKDRSVSRGNEARRAAEDRCTAPRNRVN